MKARSAALHTRASKGEVGDDETLEVRWAGRLMSTVCTGDSTARTSAQAAS